MIPLLSGIGHHISFNEGSYFVSLDFESQMLYLLYLLFLSNPLRALHHHFFIPVSFTVRCHRQVGHGRILATDSVNQL